MHRRTTAAAKKEAKMVAEKSDVSRSFLVSFAESWGCFGLGGEYLLAKTFLFHLMYTLSRCTA